MMIFMEKIEPPPVLQTNEEQLKAILLDAIENENRWVKNFIDRLAGVVWEIKR
jgi:hypothetical protein